MLTVNPITNVQNTINNISFKSGVRTNRGADVIKVDSNCDVSKEASFLQDFLGTVSYSPLFKTFLNRQKSIENGLKSDTTTQIINTYA